jgi:hypothetical protein
VVKLHNLIKLGSKASLRLTSVSLRSPERLKNFAPGRGAARAVGGREGGQNRQKWGFARGVHGVPKNAKKGRFWAKKGQKMTIFDHFGQKFF